MNSGLLAAQCALTAVKFWHQRVNDISAAAQFQTVLNCLLAFSCFYSNTYATNCFFGSFLYVILCTLSMKITSVICMKIKPCFAVNTSLSNSND